jgi:hypothetical protein
MLEGNDVASGLKYLSQPVVLMRAYPKTIVGRWMLNHKWCSSPASSLPCYMNEDRPVWTFDLCLPLWQLLLFVRANHYLLQPIVQHYVP